jgi:hypothetical protein
LRIFATGDDDVPGEQSFRGEGGAMGEWSGVRERVLALGPPPRKDRGLRRLLRRPAGSFTPLLDDPLTEDEVSCAERQFSIVFPEDYRGFLLEVGAGGFGPGYGMPSLACHDGAWGRPNREEAEDPVGPLLAHPFPSDEERARWTEQRGNLWFDPRCSDGPLAPLRHKRRSRTRFAEWYLDWLDETVQRTGQASGA